MKKSRFAVILMAIALLDACGPAPTSSIDHEEPAQAASTHRTFHKSGSPARLPPAPEIDPTAMFGKEDTIEGVWFTNFENSRFLECSGKSCEGQASSEWASIVCSDRSCEMLDSEARRITGVRANEAPTGWYRIRFVGRRSKVWHKPRYLGDGEREVRIERILDMRKVQGDN
jgi:hypothetical protein